MAISHQRWEERTCMSSWPATTEATLHAKGGRLLAYHSVDPDHMRVAVAFKNLSRLMAESPRLCHYVDNERAHEARARGPSLDRSLSP